MSTYKKKKVRPATASGILQTSAVPHILDEIRPNTVIEKTRKGFLGYEPTYLTAKHHPPANNYRYVGKQVHGGIDEKSIMSNDVRRNTIGPADNLELEFIKTDIAKRPVTAFKKGRSIKVGNWFNIPVVAMQNPQC